MNTIDKANKAKELLDNIVFKDAMADVKRVILEGFEMSDPEDKERLVHLRMSLSALNAVRAHLERYVEDGALKEFEREQEKRPQFLGDINAWMRKTKEP